MTAMKRRDNGVWKGVTPGTGRGEARVRQQASFFSGVLINVGLGGEVTERLGILTCDGREVCKVKGI